MSLDDERWMGRALELARRGLGTTWPNPMVGAVITRDGRVIGEGYHRVAGGPHAEIDALQHCDEDPRGATIYVTLEPCCHTSRTGPCCQAVLAAGLARVVVGNQDPNPVVSGQGIASLRGNGVDVQVGVLAPECAELNEIYFAARAGARPHVTLKMATDLFGRTATRSGESQWITGEAAREHVHRLRASSQAIAVGSGTALADDPRLTARVPEGGDRSPIRVLFDSQLRVQPDAALFADDGVQVIVYTTTASLAEAGPAEGARVERIACGDGPRVDLAAALADLYARWEVIDLLVEGGATLAGALVDAGLYDKVLRYMAPMIIGGDEAPGPIRGRGVQRLADAAELEFVGTQRLGPDLLIEARRPVEVPCSQD